MSNQNPTPRPRRRIAGERKVARPAATGALEPSPDEAAPAPGSTLDDRRPGGAASPPPGPPAEPVAGTTTEVMARPSRGPVPVPVMAGLGVLAVLLVLLATVGVVDGTGVQAFQEVDEQTQVDRAARTAPAVAERAAGAILSYDYETLDADRDAAARYMTPEYRKQYLDTFDGLVTDNAAKLKAVVEAEIKASGVAHADPDRVNVLLFVNQTTTSTAHGGEPQIALNRVMFEMERQGETWLVDGITSY